MTETCRAPGCTRSAHPGTLSGMCRGHLHDPSLCQCRRCSAARRQRERHVRVVEVAYLTGSSGADGQAAVSLPREPWA